MRRRSLGVRAGRQLLNGAVSGGDRVAARGGVKMSQRDARIVNQIAIQDKVRKQGSYIRAIEDNLTPAALTTTSPRRGSLTRSSATGSSSSDGVASAASKPDGESARASRKRPSALLDTETFQKYPGIRLALEESARATASAKLRHRKMLVHAATERPPSQQTTLEPEFDELSVDAYVLSCMGISLAYRDGTTSRRASSTQREQPVAEKRSGPFWDTDEVPAPVKAYLAIRPNNDVVVIDRRRAKRPRGFVADRK